MDEKAKRLENIIEIEETFRRHQNELIALRVAVEQGRVRQVNVARHHRGGLVLLTDSKHNIRFGSVTQVKNLTVIRSGVVERWNKAFPEQQVVTMLLSDCLDLEIKELDKHLKVCEEAKRKVEAQ